MHYEYRAKNTCSRLISFDLEGDVVRNVSYVGGCDGNLKAISVLIDGWTVEQIESKLRGVTCGLKATSCSDQLAQAVRQAYDKQRAVAR